MKKENRLLTIDGETLMSQPLTPLNFVVDTLISQGLHILAGSPKVGKSWLALWLAVTVAKGESVWGMGVIQTGLSNWQSHLLFYLYLFDQICCNPHPPSWRGGPYFPVGGHCCWREIR